MIFLEYFEQKYFKKHLNFHHIIMLCFTSKICYKYVIVKKIQVHLKVFFIA
jgi:hypothetical protein